MRRRKFIQTSASIAAAFSFPSVLKSAKLHKDRENMNINVGFSITNLTSCIKSKTKFRHPLQSICASIKSGASHVVILSLDLIGLEEADWKTFRENIAKSVNLSPEQILIHTTDMVTWAIFRRLL